ncbi:hypothetical protein ACHHYP_14583 [Achlya hypogyna]|uniref:Uncharacterized protein n=1 Tax=Achlya hypogyna TaxID=1202772 RepID=A0A1V9YCX2_ACHHY|nr:hypothetical protein ACHHYP_14583 [Achlya hypogyna]
MSELAAILARRRAKDGTGEPAPETPAPAVPSARPSPPKPFSAPSPGKLFPASSPAKTFPPASPVGVTPPPEAATEAVADAEKSTEEAPAHHDDEHVGRRTSSRIAQLQGNLGALNMNAFRPMPMPRKSNTSSAISTGEDYDYESTMKVGMAMPGMAGVPMIGLTKPGIGLPGMMKPQTADDDAPPAEEPTPAPVAHTTMTRAAGPKRRAPTKPTPVAAVAPQEVPIEAAPTPEATPSLFAAHDAPSPVEPVEAPPLFAAAPTEAAPASSTLFVETPAPSSRPGSSKSLFSDEPASLPVAPKPAAGPPRMNTALFGPPQTAHDDSSDSDWSDDDAPKGGLFGNPTPQPATLAAPQATLQSAPAPAQATLFGQPIQPKPETPSLFGTPASSSTSSLFGTPASSSTSSLFGGPAVGQTMAAAPTNKSRTNLFAADDSDDDSDDGGGLFGTGLPKK